MMVLVRALAALALGGSLVFAYGCGGGSSGSGSGSGNGGSSGNGNASSGNGSSCSAQCSQGSDCQSIPCNCTDGTVVNTTNCKNGCCASAGQACPDSCSSHGGWSG